MLRNIFLSIFLLAGFVSANAQFFAKPQYPQRYFQWPIGATVALAANFGELRPNHFHMGLDCKSDRAENKPIYAAAEGYVSRIKIEPWGFGRAISITHPNGFTTLYAHLNDFYPELEAWVKQQQYKQQSWQVLLDVPANLFPVRKGQFIAASGNTGGSQGPHLHFEIRDSKTEKVLNPLLFGFPIPDNQAPDVLRIAMYDRTKSTYEQSPKIFPLRKAGNSFVPSSPKIITNTNKVSFAFTAWDRYTGSTNQNGIFQAVIYDNGKPLAGFQLNDIDYIETRWLNAHIDYKTKFLNGPWLQHLSKLPGAPQQYYKTDASGGVIDLSDGSDHAIKMEISDADGNMSTVQFTLQYSGTPAPKVTETGQPFSPLMVNIFERPDISFYLPIGSLYDSVNFKYSKMASPSGRDIHVLHTPTVPVNNYFTLRIKDNILFQPSQRMVLKRWYGAKQDFKKAVYDNGWYKADFREFGYYQLIEDTTPPVILTNGFVNGMNAAKLGRIMLTVKDDSEDIESFKATLDGKWLRFTNDKGKNFIYKFDEMCPPGQHELKVEVTDLAGNITTKVFNFTR